MKYYPGHGKRITILRNAGFTIDALYELRAPPGTTDHPFYGSQTAELSCRTTSGT